MMGGIRLGAVAVPANPLVPYTLTKTTGGYFEVLAVTELVGQDPVAILADNETNRRSNPRASPNGAKVAFDEWNSFGYSEVHVVNADGTGEITLDTSNTTYIQYPAWRPDGNKIIYTISDVAANVGGDVYEINPDGTGKTLLYSPATDYCCHRPVYNYDGSLIAFIRTDDGDGAPPPGTTRELWVMNADGSSPTSIKTLTATDFGQGQFAWANTQNVIAYYMGGTAGAVRKINSDGTGDTLLNIDSNGVSTSCLSQQAWAPDDSKVYTSVRTDPGPGVGDYATELLPDGTDENILYTGNTAYSVGHARTMWVFGNRLYFFHSSRDLLSSITLAGADYRVEHDFTTDYDQITFGTGFAYL